MSTGEGWRGGGTWWNGDWIGKKKKAPRRLVVRFAIGT